MGGLLENLVHEMRRGAILQVSMDWFYSRTRLRANQVDILEHMRLLKEYGCTDESLQWLDGHSWFEDFSMGALLYRFVSEEYETPLPLWVVGCRLTVVEVDELNVMCRGTKRPTYTRQSAYWKILETAFKAPELSAANRGRRICRV